VRRGADLARGAQRPHGHANVRTTVDVYVHLFPDDDATEDMVAPGALAMPKPTYSGNVVPMHG
jgi:hypothetical protein